MGQHRSAGRDRSTGSLGCGSPGSLEGQNEDSSCPLPPGRFLLSCQVEAWKVPRVSLGKVGVSLAPHL